MKFTKAELEAALAVLKDVAMDSYDDEMGDDLETPEAFLEGCLEVVRQGREMSEEAADVVVTK